MQSDIIIIDSHKMCCTYCLTNVVCALSSVGDIKELRASLDEGQIQVVYKKNVIGQKALTHMVDQAIHRVYYHPPTEDLAL